MTNPVILLGTQSNGETLPVQVDATGRLVAEGLQGAEGPQGPQGPEGPEGPAGSDGISLPPDPFEGALLGWENGQLSWLGTPPVPLPQGVFGPIISWDPMGILKVAGGIPSGVVNSVYLHELDTNFQPVPINPDWNVSRTWSSPPVWATPNVPDYGGNRVDYIFDGNTASQGLPESGGRWDFLFEDFQDVNQIRIWTTGNPQAIYVNNIPITSITNNWASPVPLTEGELRAAGVTDFTQFSMIYSSNSRTGFVGGIEVNTKLLVDSHVGTKTGRVSQVVDAETITMSDVSGWNPQPGNYLRIADNTSREIARLIHSRSDYGY